MYTGVCLPKAFQIVVDDVGWWKGLDERAIDSPSRTGMCRRHVPEDYLALARLGKELGMRILCGFVVGEWDQKNRLACVPHTSKYGANWDMASRIDRRIREARDIILSNQAYLEMALHGLNHMYWDEQGHFSPAEFYQRHGSDYSMLPPDIARQHIETYFQILHDNALTYPVKAFIPPCFFYVYCKENHHLSYILQEYGISYVSTPFGSMKTDGCEKPVTAGVENGIITVDHTHDTYTWDKISPLPPSVYKESTFGTHWPHFLHYDPTRNDETVDTWIAYFKGYFDLPGMFPAPDFEKAVHQALYQRFTQVQNTEQGFVLDFSQVDAQKASAYSPDVYIQMPIAQIPTCDQEASMTLNRKGTTFAEYVLTRKNKAKYVKILLYNTVSS